MTHTKKHPAPPAPLTLEAMSPEQRRQLGATLDKLIEASELLSALVEAEPYGLRDLLLVRLKVDQCAVVLMHRYAEPVPPPTPHAGAARSTNDEAA